MSRLPLLAASAFIILTSWALPTTASAKTAKDCEAIQNPMEFNLCLASLSPVRGSPEARRGRRLPGPAGEDAATLRGGSIRSVRRGGRVSSVLTVGGAPVQVIGKRKRVSFDVK